jgi:hypothetical protein
MVPVCGEPTTVTFAALIPCGRTKLLTAVVKVSLASTTLSATMVTVKVFVSPEVPAKTKLPSLS